RIGSDAAAGLSVARPARRRPRAGGRPSPARPCRAGPGHPGPARGGRGARAGDGARRTNMASPSAGPLRIGLLGSGFIAHFHLQALLGVRDVQVAGVYSPTQAHREALAAKADLLGLGPCAAFPSVEALAGSRALDAVWILGPNHTRLEHMRVLHRAAKDGRTGVRAVACEKPLARNLAEAREMLRLAEDAGLLTGYLANQG